MERVQQPQAVTHEIHKAYIGSPKKNVVPDPDFGIVFRIPTRVGIAIVMIQTLPRSPTRTALPKGLHHFLGLNQPLEKVEKARSGLVLLAGTSVHSRSELRLIQCVSSYGFSQTD